MKIGAVKYDLIDIVITVKCGWKVSATGIIEQTFGVLMTVFHSWIQRVIGKDFNVKAKAKDLTLKAKAKDLTFKAKAKDLTFKAKVKNLNLKI